MTSKNIIAPIPTEVLLSELTEDKFLRKTNYGDNELYVFSHKNAPNLTQEVGRLRELTFRTAGGGTGMETDLDEFDLSEDPYQQLIVWDPHHKEILGGYRFYIPQEGATGDYITTQLSTSHLFTFSDLFKKEHMPYMIELGRSFVQPAYQGTGRIRRGIYALDNLWDGLGALMVEYPKMKYFFGKVTMYTHYNREGRNLLLYFLNKYFPDPEKMVTPIKPLDTGIDPKEFEDIFNSGSYESDYKLLVKSMRSLGENIPPLINAYMGLSPSMRVFGTAINDEFGDVEETGIMITIADMFDSKIDRHVNTYQRVRYFFKKDTVFINTGKNRIH